MVYISQQLPVVINRAKTTVRVMGFYDFPAIYDLLKRPAADEVEFVKTLVHRYVGPEPFTVLDPACGPGNWLMPFAESGCKIIANDLNESMAEFAKARFAPFGGIVTQGDMFELELSAESIELIIEASGVTSILSADSFANLLVRLKQALAPDGKIFLLLNFHDPGVEGPLPLLLWETAPVDLPEGGIAQLKYELVDHGDQPGTEIIHRIISITGNPNLPDRIEETYPMHNWHIDDIRAIAARAEMTIIGNYNYFTGDTETNDLDATTGERLLILAKP